MRVCIADVYGLAIRDTAQACAAGQLKTLPGCREGSTWMPCHLQDCEPWMSLEVFLIDWRPAARLRLLPCRAQIHQRNAGLVRILHSQQFRCLLWYFTDKLVCMAAAGRCDGLYTCT